MRRESPHPSRPRPNWRLPYEADLLGKEAFGDGMPGAFGGILRHREQAKAAGVVAADFMTTPVITIGPDELVTHAARVMYTRRLPGTSVLGIERVPVRGVPDVRAGLDPVQPPRSGQHDRGCAAVGVRDIRRSAVLRVPVGTARRARNEELAPPRAPAAARRRSLSFRWSACTCRPTTSLLPW
jgi:CBS domain-containing protein